MVSRALRDLLRELDANLAAVPGALALLVCLMPVYGIVLLMLVADPPSWVTGLVYLALAAAATLPLAPRLRLVLARAVRAGNAWFLALVLVIALSWALRSRGDPMADKAVAIAPMLMVAPFFSAQLLMRRREQRALFVWIGVIAVLAGIALLYWVSFGLLADKPRMQFGLGVRVYLDANHWTGQRIYIDPIGTAWLSGMALAIAGVYADRLVVRGVRERVLRVVLLAVVLLCAWLMLRSTGRSPLLAWAVAAAVYLVALCARPWRQRAAIAVVGLLVAAGMFAALPSGTRAYYVGTTGEYRYERPLDLTHNQPGMTAADYSARNVLRRQLVWRDHARVFLEHPVFGVGHSSAHRHARVAVDRLSHNLFIEMASGSGVIGLVALLGFLGALARVAWRLLRRRDGVEGEARTLAILAALLALASVVQLNLSGTITGFAPLYAAAGLLLGLWREHAERAQDSPTSASSQRSKASTAFSSSAR